MLPLHAASAILLSMCTFCIGFGLGYLLRKPQTIFQIVRIPADASPGSVHEFQLSDRPVSSYAKPTEIVEQFGQTADSKTTVGASPDTIRRHGGA